MGPIHLVCLRCILCGILLFALALYYSSSFLTRSVQLIFVLFHHHVSKPPWYLCSTFRNIQVSGTYKLCSKCWILLISSLTSSQICWWKVSFSWKLLLHDNAGFHFTSIICYTTEIFKMFHAFRLCFIYHNLHWEWLHWGSRFSTVISIPYHLLISVNLSMMSCNTVSTLSLTAYFTVWITCVLFWILQNTSRAFLVIIW